MKKILVAGYGNIGKALQNVASSYRVDLEFEFIDSAVNCSIEEYLKSVKIDSLPDILINLTGAASNEILLMCSERGINYIDTGVEVDNTTVRDVLEAFEIFKSSEPNVKAIIGAGMNPGIIEVIYSKYKPDYYHSAIELETDSAECSGEIFNTWSPFSLYSEFCVDNTFYYNREIVPLEKTAKQISFKESFGSRADRFNLVPHEEIVSMVRSNEKCLLSAFLYSPPKRISDYFISSSQKTAEKAIKNIPVYHDITGEDCVGILIHNEEQPDELFHYYYNRADHQECYKKYGVNGTSWQVVCGVLSAIHIIDLLTQKKVYTMTEIAEEHCDTIIEYLKTLGFFIEKKDYMLDGRLIMELQEIKNNHVLF
ncbi:MAG: hypothetical protein J1E98_00170 [Lachnospiraceae bacterium]|nr:hypothetical protein [Lachnospiraceae bacterium]